MFDEIVMQVDEKHKIEVVVGMALDCFHTLSRKTRKKLFSCSVIWFSSTNFILLIFLHFIDLVSLIIRVVFTV